MNPTVRFPTLWHRRAASVTLVGSVVLVALLGYVSYVTRHGADPIPLVATVLASGAFLMAVAALAPVADRIASWFSFVAFVLGVAAAGTALLGGLSANVHTVVVLVLSLLSLIAGMYGPAAWLVLAVTAAPYVVGYARDLGAHSLSDAVTLGFFCAFPIVASWLLWHGGVRRVSGLAGSGRGDNAYNTLAEQLDQVANESDIVISTIADGVVALNGQGAITLINPAAGKNLGWQTRDALGLDYRSVIKYQDPQGNPLTTDADPVFVALHTNKPSERSDLIMQTAANRSFQARTSITPVGSPGDGVIVVFRDVTAEKAEEREQAEFVSTASHEMRTPVAAIEGYLGLALNPSTASIDDKARTYLAKAHESAQHLGRLFQDLLDVTKADDGRLRNLPTVTDLVAFGADVVSGLSAKATEKGLALTFVPLGDAAVSERRLTPVYYADVDNDHLREVLNNLVDNAIKYTKAGSVTVNVAGDGDSVELTVRDTGLGIPREDIPHLFQKFYRVDNSDTREIGGTGLGLYLSRRLVEIMGGKIWVESEYGHGSTFTLSLPRISFEEAQSRLRALAEQRERQAANEAAKTRAAVPAAAPREAAGILPGTRVQ